MATTPTICFNESPAQADDYFNHDEIYDPVGLFEQNKDSLNTGQTSEIKTVYISHNHTDEITDVSFYIVPYTGSTSAEVVSSNSGNFNIQSGNNDKFIIKLDDRQFNYEITLTSGSDVTTDQICQDINDTINELVAFNDNNYIKLISPSRGLNSKIYIIDTNNTANSTLGFVGNDTVPASTGTTNNWGKRGNGSHGKSVGDQISYPITIDNSNNQFRISLNFTSPIQCTINPVTIHDDAQFRQAIDGALINSGFSLATDVYSEVDNGILTIISQSTQDNSYVEITSGDNDATTIIGMSNPTETGTDYANSNNVEDKDELVVWGDSGYGLELGDPSDNYIRVSTNVGDNLTNSIPLSWGDGTTTHDISRFDYTGGDSKGEIELKIRLSVPPDENETGYREWSLAVQFTYI